MYDNTLLDRLQSKDEQALLELVKVYKNKVISFCYNYTANYHDAEDLSQEVFISLFKSIGKFRRECSLNTYIYKIAVSKCVDFKRKKNIKSFLKGLFLYREEPVCDFAENDYIRQCILELPENLKVLVLLYYYIGLEQTEIADILGVTRKSVEGRIYRAKQKLKESLEKGGYTVCGKNGTIMIE